MKRLDFEDGKQVKNFTNSREKLYPKKWEVSTTNKDNHLTKLITTYIFDWDECEKDQVGELKSGILDLQWMRQPVTAK